MTPKRGRIFLMTYNLSDVLIHIHSRLKLGCLSPARPASVNLVQSQANTATPAYRVSVNLVQSQANTAYSSVSGMDLNRISQDLLSTEKEREAIKRLVENNADVFSWSDDQVGCTGPLKHWITLRTDTPIAQPYRRIPHS